MKFFLVKCTLFYVTFVITAMGQSVHYTERQLELALSGFNKFQNSASLQACKENIEDLTLNNCPSKVQSPIKEAYLIMNQMLVRLEKEVRTYEHKTLIKNKPEHASFVRNVNQVVSCMQYVVKTNFNITCAEPSRPICKGTAYAFVAPVKNYLSLVQRDLATDSGYAIVMNKIERLFGITPVVYLCPDIHQYFSSDANAAAAVLIHEVSHYCGTDDFPMKKTLKKSAEKVRTYSLFNSEVLKIKVQKYPAYLHSYNYGRWAMKGFCVPGLDCD